jgi:proteasome assembly chaperone (PAC2) family protein
VAAVDPEDYYDFQFTRPTVSYEPDGSRTLDWPGTEMCIPSADAIAENPSISKLSVLVGTEPARRWKSFAAEIMEMVEDRDIEAVLFLGAMLADVPHTRPIGVMSTSQNEHARQELEIERSQYEGPVGILSVLGIELEKAGIPAVALWASVPHYVHNTPSPKATLSLLIEVERLLGVQFDHGKLGEEAFAWERGIDEIAEGDDEMSNYISQLEKTRDEVESPAASGESLAKEFEKFLRAENKEAPEGSNDSEDEN